jgi:hypothetical protein
MTVNVSERLRDALERLDQAIDRLESSVPDGDAAAAGEAAPQSPDGRSSDGKSPDTAALAVRLDHMIARIETALAG